jgi:hypothetical protein
VGAAVTAAAQDDDLDTLTAAVLGLLAAAPAVTASDLPWLAELPLRDVDGEVAPAGELVLPGSPAAALLDPDEAVPVAADLLDRWGASLLARAGVLSGLAVCRDTDVPLDGTVEHDLDDEAAWLAELADVLPAGDVPPVLVELVAVRDLDLVRDDAWPEALRLVAADPDLRAAVLGPALVLGGGARREGPTYTAWWLSRHARIGGRPPTAWRAPDADPALRALYPAVDLPGVDRALLAAVGVRTELGPALAADVLDRLADPAVDVIAAELPRLLVAISPADPDLVPPPAAVRVPDGAATRVVPAREAAVADAPYWLQLGRPNVLAVPGDAATAVAELLDLPLLADVVEVDLPGGEPAPVPAAVRSVLPEAPATYREHDDLQVAGCPVQWWVHEGEVHAATAEGLARGLAWAAGRWHARLLAAEALRDPDRAGELAAEEQWGRQVGGG